MIKENLIDFYESSPWKTILILCWVYEKCSEGLKRFFFNLLWLEFSGSGTEASACVQAQSFICQLWQHMIYLYEILYDICIIFVWYFVWGSLCTSPIFHLPTVTGDEPATAITSSLLLTTPPCMVYTGWKCNCKYKYKHKCKYKYKYRYKY